MTAQVHLTDEEWDDLRDLTHIPDAEGAVRSALTEYRRYARRLRLKELSGQVTMEDNWRVLEEAEQMSLVLDDTCIWIPFFNRPQSAEKKAVDALLEEDRAALIGPLVTEILQGFPREAQADYIVSGGRGSRWRRGCRG